MAENNSNIYKNKAGAYFKKIIHSVKNMRFIFKIAMYILMPVVVFTIFFSYVSYTYQGEYTELVKQNYLTKLESVCNNIENTIASTSNIISNSTYGYTAGEVPAEEYKNASNILLSQLKKTDNSLLNSIFVFDRTHSCVYDEKGVHNAVAYFTDTQEYSSYPISYWENYPYANEPTRSLRPSLSFQNNVSSLLIPIVFSDTGLFKGTDCLVVVNVDISKIIEYENKSKLSQNTEFFIVNNTTGAIFNKDMDFTKKPDNSFRENVISFENNIFVDCFVEEVFKVSAKTLQKV